MKFVVPKATFPSVREKFYPGSKVREVLVEEPEDGSTPVREYLRAVRKAHGMDCVLLPPGAYPAPPAGRSIFLKAIRPGTVTLVGAEGSPLISVDRDAVVSLSGIALVASGEDPVAVRMSAGCLLLSNCFVTGGISLNGTSTALYGESCHIERAAVGIAVTGGAKAEVWGSSIMGCHVGILVGKQSSLEFLHSRVEGSAGEDATSPGAGIHGEMAARITCAGAYFFDNQLGVHLLDCGKVEMLYCLFEWQVLGGLMVRGGGPVLIHGCAFREQKSTAFGHVTLENSEAELNFCRFDPSAGMEVSAEGGRVHRIDYPPSPVAPPKDDLFLSAVAEIHNVIGMRESKEIMETILHQAHAAIQRRERGLPVPPLRFHCIFEGPVGSGRGHAAQILARALKGLGLLNGTGEVVEARMDELLTGAVNPEAAVLSASGGILMLHAAEQLDRRDARYSFARTRDILRQMLEACGEETILIFTGPRESVRPVLVNSRETEEMFRATLHFAFPSPPEVAEMFAAQASALNIRLTTKARMKILLALHMMHDRRDRRFLNASGVAKLLDAAQKRYYERCSRERNFELPMEAGDLDVPVEKLAEALLRAQPAFVTMCPSCGAEIPWLPGLGPTLDCIGCHAQWTPGWGVWLASSFYRSLTSGEDELLPKGLPPRRNRLSLAG